MEQWDKLTPVVNGSLFKKCELNCVVQLFTSPLNRAASYRPLVAALYLRPSKTLKNIFSGCWLSCTFPFLEIHIHKPLYAPHVTKSSCVVQCLEWTRHDTATKPWELLTVCRWRLFLKGGVVATTDWTLRRKWNRFLPIGIIRYLCLTLIVFKSAHFMKKTTTTVYSKRRRGTSGQTKPRVQGYTPAVFRAICCHLRTTHDIIAAVLLIKQLSLWKGRRTVLTWLVLGGLSLNFLAWIARSWFLLIACSSKQLSIAIESPVCFRSFGLGKKKSKSKRFSKIREFLFLFLFSI